MSSYTIYLRVRILFVVIDEVNLKEIHFRTGITYSTISHYLKQMEKDGLVSYKINPKDNRAKLVKITRKGLKFLQLHKTK